MADTDKGPVLVSVGRDMVTLYMGILVEAKVTGKHVRVVLNECRAIKATTWAEVGELDTLSAHVESDLYPGHLATVGVPLDWRVGAVVKKMVLTRVDEISFLSDSAWQSVKDREASPLRLRRKDRCEEFTEEAEPQDTQTEASPNKDEPSQDIPPAEETQSTPE